MALLVVNLVIFLIVIVVLVKHNRKRIRTTKNKSAKLTIQTLISIISIVSLFGLTWLFGAFTVSQNSKLPFLILFVVFSSFQGFFVFLFFCVFHTDARQAWIQFLTRKRQKTYKQKTVSLNKQSTSRTTLSTTPKCSSQHHSNLDTNTSIPFPETTQESSRFIPLNTDEYDMQEMQTVLHHTTEEEMHLNERTLDTDISLTVHPASSGHGFTLDIITFSAAESHTLSNTDANQDTDVSEALTVHPASPVNGFTPTFIAAEGYVVSNPGAYEDTPEKVP